MNKTFLINNINVTEYNPESPAVQIVIGVHGFAGDKESSVLVALGNECVKNKTILITFDLPCHGENENATCISLDSCLNSLEVIENYARQFNLPISYFATSFGAYLTLLHIQKSNISYKTVLLRAPAIYMGDTLKNVLLPEHGYTLNDLANGIINLGYQNRLFVNQQFYDDICKNNLDEIFNKKLFVNIIQGKKDDVVDVVRNEKFFMNKLNGFYKIYYIKNADHRFKNPGELEEIIAISKNIFFNKRDVD